MQENNINDPMDDKLRDQISKNWGNFCSSCGSIKDQSSIKLLRKNGPLYQYISECNSCGLKTIINLIPNLGMQVTQMRTDISYNEISRFDKPITSHDYLEFYQQIKKVESAKDLINLLQK